MGDWSRSIIALGLGALALSGPAGADMTKPAPVSPSTPAGSTAEDELNRGLRARAAKDYTSAEAAFRRALARRPAYAEAWNGLGYALRQQGKYPESLQAYHEALRLRPDFPEALEYLDLRQAGPSRRCAPHARPAEAARRRPRPRARGGDRQGEIGGDDRREARPRRPVGRHAPGGLCQPVVVGTIQPGAVLPGRRRNL